MPDYDLQDLRFYGRQKGRPLRPRHAHSLCEELYPAPRV